MELDHDQLHNLINAMSSYVTMNGGTVGSINQGKVDPTQDDNFGRHSQARGSRSRYDRPASQAAGGGNLP